MATRKVLMVLFDGFNTMDMNGPYEIFRMSGNRDVFTVTVAAETEITTSFEGVHIKRDVALSQTLIQSLCDVDILVVPGGPTELVERQASNAGGFMKLIATFNELPPRAGRLPRILLSICTGAIFLGRMGIFLGRQCTTHWGAYKNLEKTNMNAAMGHGVAGEVIPARYVDSGLNEYGTRIISSGGVSCGMDASLYVVKLHGGEGMACATAEKLDYKWRESEGIVVAP
ncbi:ThiJ/PfpI family protein [Metarhizium robertsii ARSEF 23]|nr:ThiJ/PfpI family protein [Metarhizium robertsii ARSEF 23]EFZ04334.2 ThiJ/PfpI family protein [Metarhizium robertsii ARSEF 23]